MTPTNNVNSYINYWRWLAIGNQLLKHDPKSENDDAEPGSCHFTKISVEDVLTKLRGKIGWPLLAIELYETVTESEIAYDIKLKPRGAFMVLDHPTDKSLVAQQVAYANSETILYQLLQQVWYDVYGVGVNRCKAPFKEFNGDKRQITPVGPLFGGEYGWRCEFDFEFQQKINLAKPPAEGTFYFPQPVSDGLADFVSNGEMKILTNVITTTPTP